MLLPRNITRLTSSLIKQSPYTFDVVWSESNYLLVKLNAKYPEGPGEIPDYDLKSIEWQHEKSAHLYEIREIKPPVYNDRRDWRYLYTF